MIALRKGSLLAASAYVVAVGILLATTENEIPASVETSLTLRQLAFFTRLTPVSGDSRLFPLSAADLEQSLSDLARRTPATESDRFLGAALSVALGAKHLVPLFLGPLAASNQLAEALVRWSLDTEYHPTSAALSLVMVSQLPEHLRNHLALALAKTSGDQEVASAAERALNASRNLFIATVLAIAFLALLLLIGGGYAWFRLLKSFRRGHEILVPLGQQYVFPLISVYIYFIAIFLTANILIPNLAVSLLPDIQPSSILVWTYVISGSAGLWLVHAVGRGQSTAPWSELVGLAGSFRISRLPSSLGSALKAYVLLWPAVIVSAIVWGPFSGQSGGAFENPAAVLLATDPDLALLLATVSVLAPLLEEPLFRGYFYGRLRNHMGPLPAAVLSGLAFGAAHMSWANLLPLAAIGFTLALAYERTKDLATPMFAHGLWNLVEAITIIAVFRV